MSRRTMALAGSQVKLALLAPAFVVLAACGAPASESERRAPIGSDGAGAAAPRAAAEDYFSAVRRGDGRQACDRLTADLQAGIERLQDTDCDRAVGQEARRQPDALAGYRVARVQVSGRRATATLNADGFEERLTLERVGDRWLISDAPGLGG